MKINKTGNIVLDAFLIMIIILLFIFMLVIGYKIWTEFNGKIQNLPDSVASAEVKAIIDSWTNWFLFLDKMLIFAFFSMWAGVILLSIRVNPDHPIFFFLGLFILGILTIVSFVVTDVLTRFTDNPLLISISTELGNSYFFAHNFHFISFFVMLISLLWFYVKGTIVQGDTGIQE